MNRRSILVLAVFLGTGLGTALAASPPGAVVIAKTSGNALLIWQATPFVAAVASKHETANQQLAEIESAGLQVLIERRALLKKATSASVKVMYIRTAPQNDPQYAPTSFAGFTQLLLLTATKAALNQSAQWPKAVDPLHLPPGITVNVTGKIDLQ